MRVYSIDWLGMGRSARTPLPKKQGPNGHEMDLDQVENYFVESLELWRKKLNIEKMTLLGHSLGGYFSIIYTLRYPERVEKLILASPGKS
jgi:cardiolipin-specific phospholipase